MLLLLLLSACVLFVCVCLSFVFCVFLSVFFCVGRVKEEVKKKRNLRSVLL